jgi:hypothetical protein
VFSFIFIASNKKKENTYKKEIFFLLDAFMTHDDNPQNLKKFVVTHVAKNPGFSETSRPSMVLIFIAHLEGP